MAGEAAHTAHTGRDDGATWVERVWLAFQIKHVGMTRDPLPALRRLVEQAIHEQRWAAAFALAELLDGEEAALTEEAERERARRLKESLARYHARVEEEEQRLAPIRAARRRAKEEREKAELREINESLRRAAEQEGRAWPPDDPLPDPPPMTNPIFRKEDGGRKGSAQTLGRLLEGWKAGEETERRRDGETK